MSHGIGRLWRDGFVERVRPAHIFAQQMMALTLQEGGIANGDWRWWFDNVLTGWIR
jgi:ATP-dependent helicase Lhr and Lhr-like helicase